MRKRLSRPGASDPGVGAPSGSDSGEHEPASSGTTDSLDLDWELPGEPQPKKPSDKKSAATAPTDPLDLDWELPDEPPPKKPAKKKPAEKAAPVPRPRKRVEASEQLRSFESPLDPGGDDGHEAEALSQRLSAAITLANSEQPPAVPIPLSYPSSKAKKKKTKRRATLAYADLPKTVREGTLASGGGPQPRSTSDDAPRGEGPSTRPSARPLPLARKARSSGAGGVPIVRGDEAAAEPKKGHGTTHVILAAVVASLVTVGLMKLLDGDGDPSSDVTPPPTQTAAAVERRPLKPAAPAASAAEASASATPPAPPSQRAAQKKPYRRPPKNTGPPATAEPRPAEPQAEATVSAEPTAPEASPPEPSAPGASTPEPSAAPPPPAPVLDELPPQPPKPPATQKKIEGRRIPSGI